MTTTVTQLRRPQISDEERQVRTDLAALHRLYVKDGWTALIYTHLTVVSEARTHAALNTLYEQLGS